MPHQTSAEKVRTVVKACAEISAGRLTMAKTTIEREYPFNPIKPAKRSYTPLQMCRTFIRDGFIDRYNGQQLIFPGALRLLSELLPDVVPYHLNWHMQKCHIAYWELCPTIDHIVPVARGGNDELMNWATTSMIGNQIKSNWLLQELGWTLQPPGNLEEWDGLLGWFRDYAEAKPEILEECGYLKKWHKASKACINEI